MRFWIALGLFLSAMGLASAAQDIPPGTYQQTCRDIKMKGDSLRAKCQTSSRRWIKTRLDDVDRCAGDITNIEGQLTCDKNNAPPQGTYLQTCRDVRMRYNTLWASCQTRDGGWVNTSLNNFSQCSQGIGNNNGQLVCGWRGDDRGRYPDRDDYRGNGPQGSYTQSCRDIRVSGDDLKARCQADNGDWRDTTLDKFNRCNGDIVNDDGHLECTLSGGRNVPQGTYSQTCRQIYVRGNSLRAQCETRDGRWTWTQLDDWESCRNGIVNLDGQLHCDR